MLQLKKQYGYQPYLTNQTYTILNQMFESETIELPVLEETFCNIEEMPFKVWNYVKNINYTLRFLRVADTKKIYQAKIPSKTQSLV